MSTRAMIIMKTNEDMYCGIYCHSSGYITDCGAILDKHYKNPSKIKALMAKGHISSLTENLDSIRKNRDETECAFFSDDPKFIMNQYHHLYTYLYEDGEWKVKCFNKPCWQNLKEALKQ
jgi:hypothetical protein